MARTKNAEQRGHEEKYNPPKLMKDRLAYNKKWVKDRPIAEGRRVSHGTLPDLLEKFMLLGLTSFMMLDGQIYPELVREFYANFSFEEETSEMKFRLKGRWRKLTLTEFGRIMDVSTEGTCFYSRRHKLAHLPSHISATELISAFCKSNVDQSEILSKGIKSRDLLPKYMTLYRIVDHNIYCRMGNHSHVHITPLYVMWSIVQNERINVAFLMASRMNNVIRESTRSLPYGIHLTRLFQEYDFTHSIVKQPSLDPISLTTSRGTHEPGSSRKRRANSDSDDIEEHDLNNDSEESEMEGEEESARDYENFTNLPFSTKVNRVDEMERKISKDHSRVKSMLKNFMKSISCKDI